MSIDEEMNNYAKKHDHEKINLASLALAETVIELTEQENLCLSCVSMTAFHVLSMKLMEQDQRNKDKLLVFIEKLASEIAGVPAYLVSSDPLGIYTSVPVKH